MEPGTEDYYLFTCAKKVKIKTKTYLCDLFRSTTKCRKSLLSKLLQHKENTRTLIPMAIMPNNGQHDDKMRNCYDEGETCMSSLLTSEQKTENNDQNVLELEGAVVRNKFPVLDLQVPFSAIQKEKANFV